MSAPVDVLASVAFLPEQVAALFWSMGSDEQADFFAALWQLAGGKLCLQMAGVVHEITERAERSDYDALHGFQTMLAHAEDFPEAAASWRAARAKADLARCTA